MSHYNYRDVPLTTYLPWCKVQNRGADPLAKTWVTGVKPRQHSASAEPYFRSQKELGARALVCDTFNKGGDYDALGRKASLIAANNSSPIADSQGIAGMGIKGHRQVYNVLYGDWHVSIYGDPQERVIWHAQGCASSGKKANTGSSIYGTMSTNYFYTNECPLGRTSVDHALTRSTAIAVWHGLDTAAGIDK